MAEPRFNPFTLTHRTTIILVSILPAVALFALLMGIWHCIRKRNVAKRVERDRQDEESALHQVAFLAVDEQLPERSRSTAHQVPKLRIPNLPNLPKLRTDTHATSDCMVQSAPAVGDAFYRHHFEGHPLSTRAGGIVPGRPHSGRKPEQVHGHAATRIVHMG